MTPVLSCDDIAFRYRQRSVLRHVTLAFQAGEMVGVLGVNGAGKSTLLRILLGLLAPTEGYVFLNGVSLKNMRRTEIARELAYVPQTHAANFPFTVEQMVTLGRIPQSGLNHRPSPEDRAVIDSALDRLGLQGMAQRPCTELSGGERQRVVLARALAQETRVLILDEPLTGLDYGHQLRLLAFLRDLAAEGKLVLFTSHRPEELFGHANRVLVLQDGEIAADGAPGEVVDAALMSALYNVDLAQIDHGAHRFFFSP
ncbi:ABC transporter ATP-binding protein [Kozakia baliensis]|uniref:ABC transporter n=1 Tax=Kozakia baliensis TaxID=153496 RepID=A0A1D8UQP5_9PROT|nr:ABC transporter ATP-binding protein [Kozakia baliensis]AOX15867.1 ABC transporter [Kozakia baliensis]GBR27736.1 ferrichrome ABC transporter ATP-binding protein [Kozakia baliensis NRIC 0488]GEL64256.1 iron(III) ABC transporter ATP-binding protein [Kozakia baliensis]